MAKRKTNGATAVVEPVAQDPAGRWANRIIGYGEMDPEQLIANPNNWRIHVKAQGDALAAVLDRIGWVQPVLVNRRTGYVVDGHLRVSKALEVHEPTVPVAYVDLSHEEESLVLATMDPLSALAVTDDVKWRDLTADLNVGEGALRDLIDGLAQALPDFTPLKMGDTGAGAAAPNQRVIVTFGNQGDKPEILAALRELIDANPAWNAGLRGA